MHHDGLLPNLFPNLYARIIIPFEATEVLAAPFNNPKQPQLGCEIDMTSLLSIHFMETKHKTNGLTGRTIILESLGSMPVHTKTI
jgi:hypothetical protein